MCGIAGVYGWTDDQILEAMLSRIKHRGPDERGHFIDEEASIMMGARRLSIIDIGGGTQPMVNEDGDIVVIFNGEIYNHQELRKRLKKSGHRFTTDCDTEVLVHLWEEYGDSMPSYLDGMFAFSIWDSTRESLFLARDRLGINPLYYAETDSGFIWGSELQSILATGIDCLIDEIGVYNYFALRYSPSPRTLIKEIKKLEPGTSLYVSSSEITKNRYWDVEPSRMTGSTTGSADHVYDLLRKSVHQRLMADVPIGAFLSGGIDSSSIVGIMSDMCENEVETFSVGFQAEEFDESDEAEFIADYFGTNHNQIEVDLSSMDVFGSVIRSCGEPLADPAVLPTLILSEHATKKVKVVLTGEGADELFAGYPQYKMIPKHRSLFDWLPTTAFELAGAIGNTTPWASKYFKYFSTLRSDKEAILGWAQGFDVPVEEYTRITTSDRNSDLNRMISEAFDTSGTSDCLERMLTFDLKFPLPDNLLYKVDQATMAASVEARVPYLDHDLVEFVHTVPSKYKDASNQSKPLLKKAVSDILPERTLNREKQGFNLPIQRWFRKDHEAISRWITEENMKEVPYIDQSAVFDLWRAHQRGKSDHGLTLWKILNYVAWYHQVIKQDGISTS